ncbi:MAG: ATP-dependent DNA helicase [Oscillibacter sp.]|nr:ATP-dependent DNA helicase [Oscillibacter sp.]
MSNQKQHDEIDRIFKELLPAQGLKERPEQIALSHRMLDAMQNCGIALCDAGTGIGKTFGYTVAGIVYQRSLAAQSARFCPIIISTSSIALQEAVRDEYLPLISRALLSDGTIRQPIRAVIRKGKQHYVCDELLEQRLRRVNFRRKNPRAAEALRSLQKQFDTSKVARLSGYDRQAVCVPKVCQCTRQSCRYKIYLENCKSNRFLFHITNHNLLLADAKLRMHGGASHILPDSCAIIIDEAHKLPEAARQIFGLTLEAEDIQSLILDLRSERFFIASDWLEEISAPLMRILDAEPDREDFGKYARSMVGPGEVLSKISRNLRHQVTPMTRREMEDLSHTAQRFTGVDDSLIYYAAENDKGGTTLYATTSALTERLQDGLWSRQQPILLTSGTLAVGTDFRRFKEEAGLMDNERVTESVTNSPFDYRRNCLLYYPLTPPRLPDKHPGRYYDAVVNECIPLLYAAHGHAMLLFTAYHSMSGVQERLAKRNLPWPVFTMGKAAAHTIEQFKKHPGSILLATGAAWEGFDFPGDCVSLLIIPRLPFPIPDAVSENEREKYASIQAYIQSVVVPEMQIKLKQGFGRAIRTETDTCVIAILDERAGPGKRYHKDVEIALPKMPATQNISDVERFIRRVKTSDYFREAGKL